VPVVPRTGFRSLKGEALGADLNNVSAPAAIRHLFARLRCERGVGLVELLTVLVVLGIVIAPIAMSFATGVRQEVDNTRRELAYQNARLALQRLRIDVHCANGALLEQNIYGGFTLTLTESHQLSAGGWCPGVIPAGEETSGVQWCSIPYLGSTTRWKLYRFLGTNPTECDGGSGTTFLVDYLASTPGIWPSNSIATNANGTLPTDPVTSWAGNLWPEATSCAGGRLPAVAINFNVAVDPDDYPNQHYQMIDEIAMRNADRCA
jgi:type II secretory pathway pseudopilin PulG